MNNLDNDDSVHEDYIEIIYEALKKYPDNRSLQEPITWNGKKS